jgi:hypothetical protein
VFHLVIYSSLHRLDTLEFRTNLTGVSQPYFRSFRLESGLNFQLDKGLAKSRFNRHVVRLVVLDFIVDKDVLIRVYGAHLVSKNSVTPALSINLCIVKSSYLIECYLTICVENEHGQ